MREGEVVFITGIFGVVMVFFFTILLLVPGQDPLPADQIGDSRQFSQLIENQTIELSDNPLQRNIMLVLDCSGSMDGDKIDQAKRAVATYVNSLPSDVNVGLVTFPSPMLAVDLGMNNRENLIQRVDNMRAGGGTPLTGAVKIAFNALEHQSQRQRGYGEYILVVITDGAADNSQNLQREVDRILSSSPVVVSTIGFQIGTGHTLNMPGKTRYTTATDETELVRAFQEVVPESTQFVDPTTF